MSDFLEQLADLEVKPPPVEFDRRLHERLNRSLLVQHFTDLIFGALPWAMVHFLQCALAAASFSLTGKFPKRRETQRSDDGPVVPPG